MAGEGEQEKGLGKGKLFLLPPLPPGKGGLGGEDFSRREKKRASSA